MGTCRIGEERGIFLVCCELYIAFFSHFTHIACRSVQFSFQLIFTVSSLLFSSSFVSETYVSFSVCSLIWNSSVTLRSTEVSSWMHVFSALIASQHWNIQLTDFLLSGLHYTCVCVGTHINIYVGYIGLKHVCQLWEKTSCIEISLCEILGF